MEDLPPQLILEILSRLKDSADLARCRLVSKSLNAVAVEVRSVNLQCSYQRYAKSRAPETKSRMTPFKDIFKRLVFQSANLESVSVGVEKPPAGAFYDDVEEDDDLHLTDVSFAKEWLVRACGSLRSISISDFWIQSCWRRSDVLAVISFHCHNLLELEIKNAWLSVEGLNPMPMLTSLTLEFIRLDDEHLSKVNECFPSLQVLNLIGVGGLKEPRIQLLDLKTCQWTVSNAPDSVTIIAPSLVTLKLKCVKPRALTIAAPLLSSLDISLEKAGEFKVQEFSYLKSLRLETTDLCSLLLAFPLGKTLKNLTVDSWKWVDSVEIGKFTSQSQNSVESAKLEKFSLDSLFCVFPNLSSVLFGHGSWTQLEMYLSHGSLDFHGHADGFQEVTAYLVVHNIETTFSCISFLVEKCPSLLDMALLVHRDVNSNVSADLISRCMAHYSRVRWRWGVWKEQMKDYWISDGI